MLRLYLQRDFCNTVLKMKHKICSLRFSPSPSSYISVSCCTLVDAVPSIPIHKFMYYRSCNKYLVRRALYVRQ